MRRIALLSLVALAASAAAQDASGPQLGDIGVTPRFWGLSVDFTLRDEWLAKGLDTELYLGAGGAWEGYSYFRDPSGAIIAAPSASQLEASAYKNTNFDWALGIEQGILKNERTGRNLLEAFLHYRGRTDSRADENRGQLVFASGLPDSAEAFSNSLLLGAAWQAEGIRADSRVKEGLYAEASLEWGPATLSAKSTDFMRLDAKAYGYVPLFESTSNGFNLFSAYLAFHGQVDYALGTSIPLYIRQSLGGRDIWRGLGGSVRGVDTAKYDAPLKAIATAELRLNGPAFILDSIFPALVVFADCGAYADIGGFSTGASGFVASVGASIVMDLLELAQLGATFEYALNDSMDGNAFNIEVAFGYKF
jgi:hypothetical protein